MEFVPNNTKLNFNYIKVLKDENGKGLPHKTQSQILSYNKNIIKSLSIQKIFKEK